jgi:hypothetical protein
MLSVMTIGGVVVEERMEGSSKSLVADGGWRRIAATHHAIDVVVDFVPGRRC